VPSKADRFASLTASLLPPRDPSFYEWGGSLGTVSHFLGFGWIALLLVAAVRGGRGARRALLLGLALLAFAVGPFLQICKHPIAPMPYSLLSLVPPLALEKSPTRLVWLVQLCFAIAAARGFERLAFASDGSWRRGAGLVALALAALLLVEQGETVPVRSIEPPIRIPPEIAALAREPGSFAVLDLPYDSRPPAGSMSHVVNALAMGFGADHERPIFFGLYPRAARLHEAELAKRPLFAAIHAIEAAARDRGPPTPFTDADLAVIRRDLDDLEIGAVLLHDLSIEPERFPGGAERARLREFLRRLGAKQETALAAGKGYSVSLFRF
jgi:hypothetical protein